MIAARGTPEQLGKAAQDAAKAVQFLVAAAKHLKTQDFTDVKSAPAEFRDLGKQLVTSAKHIVETADKNQVFQHARVLATANISVISPLLEDSL